MALLVLLLGGGTAASAQTESEREAAQRRLAELAQRYGTAPARSAGAPKLRTAAETTPAPAVEAAPAPAIEELPLGANAAALGVDDGGTAPAGGIDEPSGGYVLSTLAALGVVIGLVFAARWAYAKMGGTVVTRPSSVVEVLSRTAVAPKSHVLLLRVGQRVLVVGDSGGGGLQTLAELSDAEEVASVLQSVTAGRESSVTKNFNSLMSRFQQDPQGPGGRALEGGDDSEVHLDRTRDALSGLANRLRTLGGSREASGGWR